MTCRVKRQKRNISIFCTRRRWSNFSVAARLVLFHRHFINSAECQNTGHHDLRLIFCHWFPQELHISLQCVSCLFIHDYVCDLFAVCNEKKKQKAKDMFSYHLIKNMMIWRARQWVCNCDLQYQANNGTSVEQVCEFPFLNFDSRCSCRQWHWKIISFACNCKDEL